MTDTVKFMKLHQEVTKPTEVDGKPFLIVTCKKCAWTKSLPLNSGINIGMRLALSSHMEYWESTRRKFKKLCPDCEREDGIREILWGMPAGEPDESKFYLGGCTSEDFSVKYKCIRCGWEGKKLKRKAV